MVRRRGNEGLARSTRASRSHPSIIILTTTHHRHATRRHITSIAIKTYRRPYGSVVYHIFLLPLLRPHPLHGGDYKRQGSFYTPTPSAACYRKLAVTLLSSFRLSRSSIAILTRRAPPSYFLAFLIV